MWSRRSEKKCVLSNLQEQVKQLGITQQEILSALGYIGSQKKKHRAPAKYYDPKSGKSWSGYGPKPKGIEGKDLDALLVDRGQPQPWWPERESQS
ncbi:H-NS histone family protein [Burkholderia cepacia]|nr:H-NS histone family protein [Burkholderia cepacia]MBY4709442.1 H-NS histone family protein [Burkholderia cepacia]MBY4736634.1 H-NS histone family protein [Burkholderia cepacia]MBY4743763.1 H-NS histone family protein [Burkholderia cepacia]MBY4759556.1 H-NS histone family protein [Burkholderia cepacia]MBY4778943.1 H-NS histone family protein [Burkholderia cepacia]